MALVELVLRLGLLEAPRPKAMPLLDGRDSRRPLLSTESYGWSFLPLKLFMLKLLGKKEKRRLFLRLTDALSEFLRKNWKLLRRLSDEGLGTASSLLLGIALRMLTGGCLRSLFSGCTIPS